MNLAAAFAESAGKHRDKPALFWGEAEFTYQALLHQSLWLAAKLTQEFGVEPGGRVGLWMKNCPEFVPAFFAIQFAGVVAVPINNFLKPEEVKYILGDADIPVLLTDASLSEGVAMLQASRPGLKVWRIDEFPEVCPPPSSLRLPPSSESDLAALIYTSGTTGHPKGAMLTHGNLLHNVADSRGTLETSEHDRFVLALPMFHSFMLTVSMLLPLLSGAAIVLIRSLHPLKSLGEEMLRRRATVLPAAPQLFRALAHGLAPADLPLRLCISGAAPLPVDTLNEFNRKFPFPLIEGYGLSEASPVVSFNPLRGPWKAGSIGVPICNVEMSVQNDAGDLLPDAQTGEICVRGLNVMLGYWNQPEETAAALRDGWLLTGDIGHRDQDGYYFITDRKKDMLLVNGINVYPRQIEEVIYRFPGVKEAAVIGRPDPRRGEQPVAYLAMNEGASLDEKALLSFVREKLADYKVPRRVIFLPALPRNATGKILKTVLRERKD